MKLKIKIRLLNDEENLNMMKKNKYYNLLINILFFPKLYLFNF